MDKKPDKGIAAFYKITTPIPSESADGRVHDGRGLASQDVQYVDAAVLVRVAAREGLAKIEGAVQSFGEKLESAVKTRVSRRGSLAEDSMKSGKDVNEMVP